MRTLTVWSAENGGLARPIPMEGPATLSEDGLSPYDGGGAEGVFLTPAVDSIAGAAMALVPDAMAEAVFLNGAPLAGGAHLLHHADHLRVGERDFWIAVAVSPERTRYDPARHGEDMFCFRTKARLQKGEEILICGGTPAHPCGMLYRAAAWLPDSPCPHCGGDPSSPPWKPPLVSQRKRKTLDALLQQANRG